MTTRGRSQPLRLCALRMKCVSIFSAASKSAMTPSFIGRMAVMLPGVRPSISLASSPTASMRPLTLLSATIDGSLTDDAAAAGEDAGVGGAEIDGQVVGEAREHGGTRGKPWSAAVSAPAMAARQGRCRISARSV